MARTVKPRNGDGYTAEIQRLSRLRAALAVDTRINPEKYAAMTAQIDGLIVGLREYAAMPGRK